MPIYKTNILGTIFEINYEEKEHEKLLKIIERFNTRLNEFKHIKNKVSSNKIIFLAALKIESQLEEIENKLLLKKDEIIKQSTKDKKILNLTKDIITLKDKIIELKMDKKNLENLNMKAFEEIEVIEKKLNLINIDRYSKNNEEY